MKDIAALDRRRYVALATLRRYVFTAGDSGKVKRLRHSSRVIERAHAARRAKYGWQARVGDMFSRLTGRLPRRAWIEIEI